MATRIRSHWLTPVFVSLLYLTVLGNVPLQLPDEPREAEIARETWVNGPVSVPRVNGVFHPIKPPLMYAAASACLAVAGDSIPTEGSVRLASALFTLLTAAAIFVFGRTWFSVRTGALAALVYATSPKCISHGRRLLTDPAMAFFVTLAVGLALSSLRAERKRSFAALALGAGVSLGLAFLSKGPIGVIFAVAAIVGAVILDGGVRAVLSSRALALFGALALGVVPAIALWVGLLLREGGAPLVQTWIEFHLQGAAGAGAAHPQPWWFYVVRGPDGFLPWILLAPLAIWARDAAKAARPAFALRQLIPWIVAPVLFLSLLRQKRDVYMLPMVPPFALAISYALLEAKAGGRLFRATRVLWIVFGIGMAVAAVLGPLACLVLGAIGRDWSLAGPGCVLLLVSGAAFYVGSRDPDERGSPIPYPITVASFVLVLELTLIVSLEPTLRGQHTLRPLARAVVAAVDREPGATVYGYALSDGTGNLSGALAFEFGRTFPDLRTVADLRAVLERDPSARIIISPQDYAGAGRPGRVVSEFVEDRRQLVLIAR